MRTNPVFSKQSYGILTDVDANPALSLDAASTPLGLLEVVLS
jgi:hypothetical protein